MATKEPKKKVVPKQTQDTVVETPPTVVPEKKSWGIGRYFWGLLLILVGVLILLDNLGVVEVRLWNLWQLWPVFIIAAGLSVLSLRGWIWNSLGALLLIITLGAAVWVTLDTNNALSSVETSTNSVARDQAATELEVSIEAGASELKIGSHEGDQAVQSELKSTTSEIKQELKVEDGKQFVTLKMEGRDRWWLRGNPNNELEVTLTRSMPTSLHLDSGASSISADLSEVQLRSLTVEAGVSSLDITLGDKTEETNVSLDSGLSSVTIRVPKNSGVQFVVDGGLNSRSLADLEEVSENTYETKDFDAAQKKIIIQGDLGLASITLERY